MSDNIYIRRYAKEAKRYKAPPRYWSQLKHAHGYRTVRDEDVQDTITGGWYVVDAQGVRKSNTLVCTYDEFSGYLEEYAKAELELLAKGQ